MHPRLCTADLRACFTPENRGGIGSRILLAIGCSSAPYTLAAAAYGRVRDAPNCIRDSMDSERVSCTLKDMAPTLGELSANSGKRRAGKSWGLARARVVSAVEIFGDRLAEHHSWPSADLVLL